MIQSFLGFAPATVMMSATKSLSGSSFSKPEPARNSPPISAKPAFALSKTVGICIRSFVGTNSGCYR